MPSENSLPAPEMIKCPNEKCGADNPRGQRYCGDCGMTLDPDLGPLKEFIGLTISKEIKVALTDARVIEIETAEKIWMRLWGWAKTFGIIMGLILTAFGVILVMLGYSNYEKFLASVDKAQTDFESKAIELARRTDDLEAKLKVREGSLAVLDERFPAVERKLAQYDVKLPDIAKIVGLIAQQEDIKKKLAETPDIAEKIRAVENFGKGERLKPDEQEEFQKTLEPYQEYLRQLGFSRANEKLPGIKMIDQENIASSFYFENAIYLGKIILHVPENLFHEYTHHALLPGDDISNVDLLLEYGLAAYLVCSFMDNPQYGRVYVDTVKRELPNEPWVKTLTAPWLNNLASNHKFETALTMAQVNSDVFDPHSLVEVWGGAFWEMRGALGKDETDRLLCSAWKLLPRKSGSRVTGHYITTAKVFLKCLLDQDRTLNGGKNSGKIKEIFERHNLKM